jgi:hypothetical protein
MARPRQFALVLCATVTLAGWSAARLGGFEWSDVEHTAASIWNRAAAPGATTPLPPAMAAATTLHLKLPAPAVAHAAAPAADAAVDPDPMSGRSMTRNISSSVACRLCERQDCKKTRDKPSCVGEVRQRRV